MSPTEAEAAASTRPRSAWLALVGLLLALATWWTQPLRAIYTDLDRLYYQPDPDLGWKLVEAGALLLGLDLVMVTFALTVLTFVLARMDRPGLKTVRAFLAICCFLPAATTLILPGFPSDASLAPPSNAVIAPEGIEGGLEGLKAGRWTSNGIRGRGVIARVPAGGEVFDTRFGKLQSAILVGDPSNLRQPLSLRVEALSASADTGVDSRSKSTREYLKAQEQPLIVFELTQLEGAKQLSPTTMEFAAQGSYELMGRAHPTPITGSLKALDAEARQRLGVDADAAFSVNASFVVHIADTALKAKAQSFDGEDIEIEVELIFVPASGN